MKTKNKLLSKMITILVIVFLFSSCGNQRTAQQEYDLKMDSLANAMTQEEIARQDKFREEEAKRANEPNIHPAIPDSIVGHTYTGDFVATKYNSKSDYTYINRITIGIDSVSGNHLYGFSVVAGNKRSFSGIFRQAHPGTFDCEVKEAGDNKYDGRFEFSVTPVYGTLKGNWFANDNKLDVTERRYELKYKFFVYEPANTVTNREIGELYAKSLPKGADIELVSNQINAVNASTSELKKEELENLYKGDLEILRNTIYARHGYSFKGRRMRYVFDNSNISWYMPISTDVRKELTELEKKNIELIKVYEEHAGNYYDKFGR